MDFEGIGIGVSFAVGFGAAFLGMASKRNHLIERLRGTEKYRDQLQKDLDLSRNQVLELSKKLASNESTQIHLEERLRTQQDFMAGFEQKTKTQFENLAQNILDAKSKIFSEQTEKNLGLILTPLRER